MTELCCFYMVAKLVEGKDVLKLLNVHFTIDNVYTNLMNINKIIGGIIRNAQPETGREQEEMQPDFTAGIFLSAPAYLTYLPGKKTNQSSKAS